MKTRAAVALEVKHPLEIVELDLDGPRVGEVQIEIMATGVCHTDACTAECRPCKSCLSGKTYLCTAIHATQGRGLMPNGKARFGYKGRPILHYTGCSTFSNFTIVPEIAVAKIRKDAPFDKSCYVGCGVSTGIGAVVNTAKVEPGANLIVFRLGGVGLNVIEGARAAGPIRQGLSTGT